MISGIDGLGILQQLHANAATRHIPVILFTAKGRSSQQTKFDDLDDLNVQGTIGKPFNPVKLIEQITTVLN
ncbi:hypothetical protein NDI45_26280 [Leptolyngbya sp. GB1-A1]|uniref:hypothetical protein n=1 Tax=Leptolyngbya sp. GB1-A1 TaxID=2933908 RepID=UPI0032969C90